MFRNKIEVNWQLFKETSHTPSLIDIVGERNFKKVTDFCFIENPYFPSKKTIKKLVKKLPEVIKKYPSGNPTIVQQHLASVISADSEHLILGNGATELITVIQNRLVKTMGIPVPTFSEYIEKVQSEDKVRLFPLSEEKSFQLDLNEYADWLNNERLTSALVINPGNPTGQLFSVAEMKAFLEKMRHLDLVLVDESFIDFSENRIPTLIPFVKQFTNLLIVRSMSKHCGVPGLRLGYCCTANTAFLKTIRGNLPVWNLNTLAEYFLAQLKDMEDEYHIARKKVIADIELLYQQLSQIEGFIVYPTGSNFILMKVNFGTTAYEVQKMLLEEHGVYVRDCTNKEGLDQYHIRVASQGRKKDKLLIGALKRIVAAR
uniref:pyridoxal phosphate-dependent aminotransferase n=1 Tax=uncultured Draconibacterium sp. TaxID=1573823 RepID=UPI003216B7EF